MQASRGKPTIYLVLPAFNEEVGLPRTVAALATALRDLPHRIVVVDDGSRDATADRARELAGRHPLNLVRHPANRGLAAALRSGIIAACEEAAPRDVLITLDADDTQPAGLAPRLARLIASGCDLAIASRYRGGSRVVGLGHGRKLLSATVSAMLRVLLPVPGVTDYSSGYRAYRVGLLQDALARGAPPGLERSVGFEVQMGILFGLARQRRLRVGELPFVLRYDRKVGSSRLPWKATAAGLLRLIRSELQARGWPGALPYGDG